LRAGGHRVGLVEDDEFVTAEGEGDFFLGEGFDAVADDVDSTGRWACVVVQSRRRELGGKGEKRGPSINISKERERGKKEGRTAHHSRSTPTLPPCSSHREERGRGRGSRWSYRFRGSPVREIKGKGEREWERREDRRRGREGGKRSVEG
jgi:hypothetical protein